MGRYENLIREARAILLGLSLLLLTQNALALRVLVIEPERSDTTLFEAFGRLRAELQLQSFEVLVLKPGETQLDPHSLEREAQSRDAFAAIALLRDAGSTTAELWIVDRVTGKTVQRKLKIDDGKEGPTLLAIRAVDLLRTSLTELEPGETPPTDVLGVETAAQTKQLAQFTHALPRFQVRLGATMLAHPSLGFSAGASVELAYHPTPRFSLGLEFIGPVFGGEYQANNGAASVRQELLMLEAALNLGASEPGSRWEWGPTIGLGVSHLVATGIVEAPLLAKQNDVWAFALNGGMTFEFFFTDAISVGAEVSAVGLIPQPVIAVTDQESAPLAVQALAGLALGVSF